jgi:hypothetical protein
LKSRERRIKMKKLIVVIPSILALLATMSIQGLCEEDVINACYKKVNGQLRIVDDPEKCNPSESPISWGGEEATGECSCDISREEFEDLVARVAALEGEEPELPCQEEGCCNTASDCPDDYRGEPLCANPSTCQGNRMDAVCEDNVCSSTFVDDDSACDTNVVSNDCGLNLDVFCNGEEEQSAPPCPTSCTTSDDCDSGASCEQNQCEV